MEADGTVVGLDEASGMPGQTWAFTGTVYDEDGFEAGKNFELDTRLNKEEIWLAQGTYMDLYGCHGQLTWEGPYTDITSTGYYTITGGTGDFEGAVGYIMDEFYVQDKGLYVSYRHIKVN